MEKEREIGRVMEVNSTTVTIEPDKEIKAFAKSFYKGVYPVARINSYVIIPVADQRIVALITRVLMHDEVAELHSKASVVLPESKKLLYATMIGTLDPIREDDELKYNFFQGVTTFPALDNPVWFVLEHDLDAIFDKKTEYNDKVDGPPQYFLPIGESTAFPGYKAKIDPDRFFSKHAAVLGNTGSGKTSTIASLLQTILKEENVKNGHFIIFDINGEYKSAFPSDKSLTIADPSEGGGLKIPYWFMNFEDMETLFEASEKTQSPVLNRAVILARSRSTQHSKTFFNLQLLQEHLENLYSVVNDKKQQKDSWRKQKDVFNITSNLIEFLNGDNGETNKKLIKQELQEFGITEDLKIGETIVSELIPMKNDIDERGNGKINIEHARNFIQWWDQNLLRKQDLNQQGGPDSGHITVDSPAYFRREELRSLYIPMAMRVEGGGSDISQHCVTLNLRIRTLFSDPRYKFLFDDYKNFSDALALFLRLCFGQMDIKYTEEMADAPFLRYYKTETHTDSNEEGKKHQVVIFDLSLLPSDVLDNITALLGRLILEFLQRYGKNNKEKRGNFPVVLVLEEAHNYIPERRFNEEDTLIARKVFERIAKEGRKFGLSLVVSSQRPSELSRTVMSQCNSFIVHRIQNPDDQEYVKKLVPSINQNLLSQLPILPQRHALIFGDCVRSPMEIKINEIEDKPDSHDPLFYKHWIDDNPDLPNFEEICKEWEGQKDEGDQLEIEPEQEANSTDTKPRPIPSIPTEAQEAPSK